MNNKSSKNNLYVGLFLILIGIGVFLLYSRPSTQGTVSTPDISFSKPENQPATRLMDFNPNDLSLRQWQQLGFSEKQAQTILNYKKSLGGTFSSRQEFSRCYAVSPQKFAELREFITLPEGSSVNTPPHAAFGSNKKYPSFASKSVTVYKPFDPNALDAGGWQQMGFSPKQAEVIMKYKRTLGGSFTSEQQLADCFVISPETFAALKPYLRITPSATPMAIATAEKPVRQLSPFDPNSLTKEGWMALGYSEKQAQSIINYKEKYLRGAFRTLEDVEKNFILKDRFTELKPYLILPASSAGSIISERPKTISSTPASLDLTGLDLNSITKEQLQQGGVAPYLAGGIINYRKLLGGFVDKKQLYEVYNMDRETADILIQKTRLSESAEKYSLVNAPESWLKTHPYFRYHADKIIYYRVTYPDEKKIWKFLKVRPDQEAKMRMYLL